MCGICGVISLSGKETIANILPTMVKTLTHRGPDGEGIYVDGNIGFAHRRLAIIDLSEAAHQPMISKCNNYVMTYNGEIYNYQELRKELEKLGYVFRSNSDTEVVLIGYIAWGAKILDKLNGMFAFAIYDKYKQKVFLARDRYGIKPLYYYQNGDNFIFSSEIRTITSTYLCDSALDKASLVEYFTFQNIFTDNTFFKNVKLLPNGTYMEVTYDKAINVKLSSYWDYKFVNPDAASSSQEEYVEELDRLFMQSVKRQLVSDVPVASYLSGGMDSGSITAIAAQNHPNMRTFTVGFDLHSASGMELAFDEREKAEYMSYLFNTEHYEMVLKAGDMEKSLIPLMRHLETPRVGQSYPNYYAAQLASKFNKVVLSGAGGDELFAGYPWRYYRAVVNNNFDNYIDKYYAFWQRLLSHEELKKVLAPCWSEVGHVSPKEIFKSIFTHHADTLHTPEDYINHSLYFETKTFLHGLLIMEDKLSMAHGLETRLPFLDNDLVDFAMRIPVKFKLGNLSNVVGLNENEPGPKTAKYYQKTNDGKLILRKTMERHIPTKVTSMVKQGFSAPDASWFKGESIDYVRRLLLNKNAAMYEFMDYKSVTHLVDEHLTGKRNRRLLIWSLISFENWCQLFL